MFLKKKLIAAALVAVLGLSVYAQTSNTNAATQGIFGTDVDAYMDVNSWSTVAPEKFFAYAEFSSGTPSLGFAKDFGAFYWGTFFNGNIGNISNEKTVTGNSTSIDNNHGNNTMSSFKFSNLFGFGNIGVKLELNYINAGSSKSKIGDVTTTTDVSNLYFNLEAGLSDFELAGLKMLPSVIVGYDNNMNPSTGSKITTDNNGNKTIVDTRWTSFGAGLKDIIILKETDSSKQSVTVEIAFSSNKPADKDIKDVSSTNIDFPVSYKIEFAATEKLKLGFEVGSENSIFMSKSGPNVKDSSFSFDPYIESGLTFDTGKKVVLNAGIGLNAILPTIETGKSTNAVNNPSTTVTTTTIGGTNAYLSLGSGFAVKPTNNLTIDFYCGILYDLFGNSFNVNFTNGYNDIWATVNDILIHNFSFEVSYKL